MTAPPIIISPPFPGSAPVSKIMRAQISSWLSTDPKLDKVTNTVYFAKSAAGSVFLDADYQAIATDLLAAFNVGSNVYCRGMDRQQVKVYDLGDAEPRPPRAVASSSVNTATAGAREVALCLSFRAAPNNPRQRGRIYLGPFGPTDLAARPSTVVRDAVHALAGRLADIGGADIDWSVFSPTAVAAGASIEDGTKSVKHSWVDDAWDIQRSRGLPPASRVTQDHDE